ncbi:alanine--glyoxylate aminotransferase 2-like protein 3, mitochondrial-like [Senna tora]|uniref:Alanine--glyoxylate aminotransferase 2-like protein 3, mitochondrial-like n=1 Tax=Senna tora TaxID=362788 RepID=A0A834TNB8_9FABA|nr:alanine--glyoxylate aminotransferase 2-like protein 3, mitochondrial-like [Senna tora]
MATFIARRKPIMSMRYERCFSQLADKQNDAVSMIPELPPFDYSPPPYDGPSGDEIMAKRKQYLSPALLFHLYKTPLNVVEGKKQYLYDEKGRRYLDAFGGIATVSCGHCHPDVVAAIANQSNRLQHSTVLYLNHVIADFAQALASKLPANLKVVFFTNSGTEANELAMLMARLYSGCHDIISLRNAYHGNASATMGATAQSNWKFNIVQVYIYICFLNTCFSLLLYLWNDGIFSLGLNSHERKLISDFVTSKSGVHHAVNPDPYRGIFGSDGEKYAKEVQDMIDFGTSGNVAAFLSESIQGVGGMVELAPGYLPAVYNIIRKAGGLCIADEVQTGFARTGSNFWGFEAHGVVPDIVTMAKGIGNGIPLGAVVTTPEIAQVLTHRTYYNTFGGNPVCTAAGLAVLRVIEKEKLQQNAFVVGDVRGRGLMLGVELVTDHELKTPAKEETLQVLNHMKELGALIGKGGYYGNVLRITPPLCFTKEDADFLVDAMDLTLSRI